MKWIKNKKFVFKTEPSLSANDPSLSLSPYISYELAERGAIIDVVYFNM